MKKLIIIFIAGMLSMNTFAGTPDEGMWLPIFVERLNYLDMQEMGLQLTADEIYSINHSSMKDAIVNFGNFCTAEVVSENGLLFTNHHCGYDAIQSHSSIDHDYLTDGFWAGNYAEELPNEGLTATFFVRMEDITSKVLEKVKPEMTEDERSEAIGEVTKELKEEASEEGKYEVEIKGFFNGNEYYLFVYEVFKDVRLVGAPPSSIGKYGGDTDNWMWPRHTGDFSIFRVYTAPDGSPATYAEENIPFKPKYHLPISLKGVEKNDFAMIWGYPGGTNRYMTSWGIRQTLDETDPAIIHIGDIILALMKEDMDADDDVRIKYASKYAMIANLWKNKIGESRGLKRLKVYDKKRKTEEEFEAWVNASPERKEKYGEVLNDFAEAYGKLDEMNTGSNQWYFQAPLFASTTMIFPLRNQGLASMLENKEVPEEVIESFRETAKENFKDYNAATEEKLYAASLQLVYDNVPKELYPDIFQFIEKKYKNDFKAFAADVFEKSIFATEENYNAFLDKPNLKKLKKDLAYRTTQSFYQTFIGLNGRVKGINDQLKKAKRLFVAGLREMNPDEVYYPDANFTMRLTYGSVLDYKAADAVYYDYVTHLYGVMEKEDPTNDEFIVADKLKELYKSKDYGQYGEDGKMVVCFLTNNDITGGNSGSPVINGNGELIGIAFDGNWEAMSGDIAFEPELQRTISVDIRYVLLVIDKFAGAKNIIDELTLVK